MKKTTLASLRRLLIVLGASVALGRLAAQESSTVELPAYVFSATRTPVALTTTGTYVDTLSAAELARMQLTTLQSALGGIPGAPAFQSGPGGVTSLFLRGSNSNQTLFLVDGIRLNDANTDYQVFLGGATLGANDRLEVAHGPQSTLYGGEAVGGVVALNAQRGSGPATGEVSVEAGSFGTVQGSLQAQGADGPAAYTISVAGGGTQNERPNNDFASTSTAVRLDRTVGPKLNLGGTLRWFHSDSGVPGDRYTNDPNDSQIEDNVLVTVFAEFIPAEHWSSRLTLGDQERRYVLKTPAPNPPFFDPSQTNTVRNHRAVLDWQATFAGLDRHRITAGVNAEQTHTRNDGFGLIDKGQSQVAVFAQDEFTPRPDLFLTAGLRSDDFDTFGRATTGRVTAAWLAKDSRWKLRASYGTAFRSPSFLDLYGRDTFYVGNPNLRPETARGWDAGVDYFIAHNGGVLSATWFDNRFRNLITSDFSVFPSTEQNVGSARTSGVELAGKFALPGAVQVRLAYTYLEADNLTDHTRLLRRPRHSGSLDVWHDFGHGLSAGTGLAFAAQREDVDALTFATINEEDYTVGRIYGAWQVSPRVTLKVRVENLLDEKYEEVNGYPAPGLGVFAGVTVKL